MPIYDSDELQAHAPILAPSLIGTGLLPETGCMLIVGRTESGKSVIAFDMAISLGMGAPLFRAYRRKHGQEGTPYFPVHKACRVLYLDSELGPRGCHDRLGKFYRERLEGVSLQGNLKIVSGAYDPILLHPTRDASDAYEHLKKLITEYHPRDERGYVVVVDPLGDYHLLDEDSNQMRVVFRYLRALQNDIGFASLLLHHESDKQAFSADGSLLKKTGTARSRGHSSITQSVDTVLSITRERRNPYTFVDLNWDKTRHQEKPTGGWLFVDFMSMKVEWFKSHKSTNTEERKRYLDKYKLEHPIDPDSYEEDT